MKKKIFTIVTVVLVAVVCLATLTGCDSSATNVKHVGCEDYLFETGVNITMSKRLPKVGMLSGMEPIKYKKSLAELFDLMQMEDGYTKTLFDDYILIETAKNGKLYTWGIFTDSVFGEDYEGEYNYVCTNMCVNVNGVGYGMFFFPIYTMYEPLLIWNYGERYKCALTIDELAEFYTQHGIVANIEGNVLTVTAQVGRVDSKREEKWRVTYHSEHELSVAI